MSTIDQTISQNSDPAPDKDEQEPATFNQYANTLAESMIAWTDEYNQYASEANNLRNYVITLRDESFDWANAGEDDLLEDQAGHEGYSSYHHRRKAVYAQQAAETARDEAIDAQVLAEANANFKGNWSDLSGSLSVPASVYHLSEYWMLLNERADVTTSEPGYTNSDWANIALSQAIKLNKNSVDVGFTIPSGYNAVSVSPIDINATVDVAENSVWEVI